ncbi:MAG: hypothetical protein ACTTH7_08435 [Treponema sp.]
MALPFYDRTPFPAGVCKRSKSVSNVHSVFEAKAGLNAEGFNWM